MRPILKIKTDSLRTSSAVSEAKKEVQILCEDSIHSCSKQTDRTVEKVNTHAGIEEVGESLQSKMTVILRKRISTKIEDDPKSSISVD